VIGTAPDYHGCVSDKTIPVTDELADYIRRISLREPEVLSRLRAETAQLPNAQMQSMPEQCQFMAMLVHMLGSRRALEIGVFTGYSTLWTALALPEDGRIIACDTSEEYTSIARRYWKRAGVQHKIDLRLAPALQTLDTLLADGSQSTFDFVFIDADKENYWNYYERALQLLRRRGLILVDNVLWSGRVADDSVQDKDTLAIREFNRKVAADERVWITLLPYADGLTIACKK
jgi:caffeoyl-CoA O-methyltransferase